MVLQGGFVKRIRTNVHHLHVEMVARAAKDLAPISSYVFVLSAFSDRGARLMWMSVNRRPATTAPFAVKVWVRMYLFVRVQPDSPAGCAKQTLTNAHRVLAVMVVCVMVVSAQTDLLVPVRWDSLGGDAKAMWMSADHHHAETADHVCRAAQQISSSACAPRAFPAFDVNLTLTSADPRRVAMVERAVRDP
jgi:hypothetical protein